MIYAVSSPNPQYAEFVKNALNPSANANQVESIATHILKQLGEDNTTTGQDKRYKFAKGMTGREQVLTILFDRAFKSHSTAVIAAARQVYPSQPSFYSRWKAVCWIQIPERTSIVVKSLFMKIALTICTIYSSWIVGKAAYKTSIEFTQRCLPFIINNTPVQVIRFSNNLLEMKSYIRSNIALICLCAWVAQRIILRGPRIPFLTSFMEKINLWEIFCVARNSPTTIGAFFAERSVDFAKFAVNLCTDVGNFLEAKSEQAKKERDVICKTKSFAVWKKLIIENVPSQ